MGNFNRGAKRSGGGFNRGFGSGGSRFGGRDAGRDSGRRIMHQATCSECGERCELPFRPTGDRPVYCSDCFGKQNDGGGERRPRPRFEERGGAATGNDNREILEQIKMLSAKIDTLIKMMSSSAPVEKKEKPVKKAITPKKISVKKKK